VETQKGAKKFKQSGSLAASKQSHATDQQTKVTMLPMNW
jgi:hypothetical protein